MYLSAIIDPRYLEGDQPLRFYDTFENIMLYICGVFHKCGFNRLENIVNSLVELCFVGITLFNSRNTSSIYRLKVFSFGDVLFFKIVIMRYIPSLFRNFLTIISSLYGIIHRNNIKYRYHLCFYAIIKRRWFLMELRQIRYFMEVAKREHVTEAANALHVAQSAVSRQIFNLESEL